MHDAFVANNGSVHFGLSAVLVLYHMYDKFYRRQFGHDKGRSSNFPDENTYKMFKIAQRLANSSKHAEVTIETIRQSGFSSGFSDGFARPLNVKFDGEIVSLDNLVAVLYTYWEGRLSQRGALLTPP